MRKLKLILTAAVIATGSFVAFAFTSPHTPSDLNSKSGVSLYWFDANTGDFIGQNEESGCDESTLDPCSLGYTEEQLSDPSNPEQPSTPPVEEGKGIRP